MWIAAAVLLLGAGLALLLPRNFFRGTARFNGMMHEASTIEKAVGFSLESPAFDDGMLLPAKYTCDGPDGIGVSPPLVAMGAPKNTKSFALIMDDPDAPGRTWDHWVVFNIPPETRAVREGEEPLRSVAGKNSWGKTGYGGPCPPSGVHRYVFSLYALDRMLPLPSGATKDEVLTMSGDHIIAKAVLVGLYQRKEN